MKVVKAYPPNYAKIVSVLPGAVKHGIVFTYGDTVYAPSGVELPPEIMAHEAMHCQRQHDPEAWWAQYLADPQFRMVEELYAHAVEYEFLASQGNRHQRRGALVLVAKKLSAPLYGRLLTPAQAQKLIRKLVSEAQKETNADLAG